MEEGQLRKVNEAAERFVEAIEESYRNVAESASTVSEVNVKLTQEFFNGVMETLKAQAEPGKAVQKSVLEQQDASRQLAQESVSAYMDFVNSMFAHYRTAPTADHAPIGISGPTAEEIAECGQEIYEAGLREKLEAEHSGEFVVIDVQSGDVEIAEDDLTASDRALAKNPNALLYGVRIGESAAYHIHNLAPDVSTPMFWR